jgi:hypothetical protein
VRGQDLQKKKEAAFVSGGFKSYYEPNNHYKEEIRVIAGNPYTEFLKRNYIGMIATVMFRHWVLEQFSFDGTLWACEDYDLFLKISKRYKVIHHNQLIAVYRLNHFNTSSNTPKMLQGCLKALSRQQGFLTSKSEKLAYYVGLQSWKDFYASETFNHLLLSLSFPHIDNIEEKESLLWKYNKGFYFNYMKAKIFVLVKSFLKNNLPLAIQRGLFKAVRSKEDIPAPGTIDCGDFNRTTPFSTRFGYDRGGPVDRYYIENFLLNFSSRIKGRVLEIGDNEYTLRFGENRITQSDILHIDKNNPKATFIGDLTHNPQLPDNSFDCIILTETLQLIDDFEKALETCHRILKPGGTLLITVPGITNIAHDEWGKYWMWSFTDKSITRLLAEFFPKENIIVEAFGNVFVAMAFLYGMGLPELNKEQLDYTDPHYQVKITGIAIKAN